MLPEKYKPIENISIERKDDGIPLCGVILAGIAIILWIILLVVIIF